MSYYFRPDVAYQFEAREFTCPCGVSFMTKARNRPGTRIHCQTCRPLQAKKRAEKARAKLEASRRASA